MGADTDWDAVADSAYREFVEDERREKDQQHLEELEAEVARLRAEVEGLRVRASRYDWIRRNAILDGANGDQLDSEIDAAMGASA